MKYIIHILALVIILIQCTSNIKTDATVSEWTKVEHLKDPAAFSMFIQKEPTSAHFWDAIDRYCFLNDSLENYGGCYRTNADIESNGTDQFLFNAELCDSDSLTQLAYNYLINTSPFGSLKIGIGNNKMDTVFVSEIHFNFPFYDKSEVKESLQKAVMAVSLGIDYYKEHLSIKFFDKKHSELSKPELFQIDDLIGDRLWFYDFKGMERIHSFPIHLDSTSNSIIQ